MILKVSPSNMYTFRYESGLTGTDIDFIDTDNSVGPSLAEVYPEYGVGRGGVLALEKNIAANEFDVYHEGFNINTTGAIEFLVRPFEVADTEDLYISLYDGATRLVTFFYDDSAYDYYYDNGGGNTLVYNGSSLAWRYFSIRIDVDAGINGQFDIYIYDNSWTELGSATGIEFENNATTVDKIRFYTQGASGTGVILIDCVGITAEGSYTQGNIQYAETDISNYTFDIRIHDGIIPYKKFCTFRCHPDDNSYFNEEDFIDIFNDSGTLLFAGKIKTKYHHKKGWYEFECDGMANEVWEIPYTNSYSSDATDTKQQDIIDNACEFCYRSSSITGDPSTNWSYEYNRAIIYLFYLARFLERQVCYIAPDGKIYTVSHDDLVATGESWDISDTNQNAVLIDIPKIDDEIPGYYAGNTGITAANVLYMNNTEITRPSTPTETFKKKKLHRFTDLKIQASTEAAQLATNLYNIFSTDTIFLGLRIHGEGWLQPGKTIQIQSTGRITITQAHFLILKVIYDPQNDTYEQMILSNNIITPKEFKTDLALPGLQIHTAITQAAVNQDEINVHTSQLVDHFIWRSPETGSWDFQIAGLTDDTNYNDMDLSGIIDSGTTAVLLRLDCIDGLAGSSIVFRQNGQTGTVQNVKIYTQVANKYNSVPIIVGVDSDGKCEIKCSPKPTDWTGIYIVVLGWWV